MPPPQRPPRRGARPDEAAGTFRALYGRPPTVVGLAPGRVNLVGEHTDYNDGYALPVALPHRVTAELAPRDDRRVRAWTDARPDDAPATWRRGEEARAGRWTDYVQGVCVALARAGHHVGGFDLRLTSEVPPGAGLSSSAALAIALLRALRAAYGLPLGDVDLARLGRVAENDFVGAPVGDLDFYACSLAEERRALFLDTRGLVFRLLPLPAALELAVVDSGIPHAHAAGGYRTRRAECARAAALLGVPALRDAPDGAWARLPAPLDRRARHVATENARVLAAVAALEADDLPAFGRILSAAHASLRDDFEVSLPPIDRLVAIAEGLPGVFGARLTGGGFGGAIVLACAAGSAAPAAAETAARWARETGGRPTVRLPRETP